MSNGTAKPAVFVDRDHTLIDDPGYISEPDQVRLLAGVPPAIARLREAGTPVIVVTNQSGVARGLFTEEQLAAVHQRMQDLLQAEGTGVDAIYYCPYLDGPEAVCEDYRRDSDLRKPKPGLLRLAAREMDLDLKASWMIGDSERDVQAGRAAGCRTVLIDLSARHTHFTHRRDAGATTQMGRNGGVEPSSADHVAADLPSAVEYILTQAEAGAMKHTNEPSDSEPSGEPTCPQTDSSRPEEAETVGKAEHSEATDQQPGPRTARLAGDNAVLREILDELRMIRRQQQHEDFSIGKLAGAIAQAFALCAVGWGLYSWMNAATDPNAADSATVSLLIGIAFQLMALTFFATASKK